MASTLKAQDARTRYWKTMMIKHLREHPAGSVQEATASLANEFARLLDAEVEAEKRGPR